MSPPNPLALRFFYDLLLMLAFLLRAAGEPASAVACCLALLSVTGAVAVERVVVGDL